MSIKVVKQGKPVVYKTHCPACGAEIEYATEDVIIDDKHPVGYVRCPVCNAIIKHDVARLSKIQSDINNKKADIYDEQIKILERRDITLLVLASLLMAATLVLLILGIAFVNIVCFILMPFTFFISLLLFILRRAVVVPQINRRRNKIYRLRKK